MAASSSKTEMLGALRKTAVELGHERRSRAGCVQLASCRRGTGPLVGVYKAREAGIDTGPENPWAVCCETHGTHVAVHTRAEALSSATDTRNFCDACRDDEQSDERGDR